MFTLDARFFLVVARSYILRDPGTYSEGEEKVETGGKVLFLFTFLH